MANFGALTDHFSAITTGLTLVGSTKTPTAKGIADAQDENGDIACRQTFGATDIYDVTCEYELQSGEKDLSTMKLGEIVAGTAVASINVSPSNGSWPKFSISGRTGLETMVAPEGKTNTFTLPGITVKGMKAAQPLGFTVEGGSLTECSIEVTAEIAETTDGEGNPSAHGISGASGTINATFVRCPDEAPEWALTLDGAESVQEPGANEPQAAFHTATAQATFKISRDDAPEEP